MLIQTAIVPLNDFDGRAFWVLKAKAISAEDRVDGPTFAGKVVFEPKNEYPLLIPIDGAVLMRVSGELDDRYVRWIYPMALMALAWRARRIAGAWPAALLPWVPQLALDGAPSASNDVPLGAFIGAAFFDLVEGESPIRFGFWLSFILLTKNEGLPIAIVLGAAGAFVFRRKFVTAIPPVVVALATLLLWRHRLEPTDEENFLSRLSELPHRLDRIPGAIGGLARHAFSFDVWGLFWIAVVACFVLLLVRRRWREAILSGYVLSGIGALYVTAYVVTVWKLNDIVEGTADRLLTQLAGPAVFVIGRALIGGTASQRDGSPSSPSVPS